MRKTMWKKGLSVAMAAAMLAGPVNVPAVFHNVAIVKADEATGLKDPKTLTDIDGYYYATVNMEYADYYYGELNKVSDVSISAIVNSKYSLKVCNSLFKLLKSL